MESGLRLMHTLATAAARACPLSEGAHSATNSCALGLMRFRISSWLFTWNFRFLAATLRKSSIVALPNPSAPPIVRIHSPVCI